MVKDLNIWARLRGSLRTMTDPLSDQLRDFVKAGEFVDGNKLALGDWISADPDTDLGRMAADQVEHQIQELGDAAVRLGRRRGRLRGLSRSLPFCAILILLIFFIVYGGF